MATKKELENQQLLNREKEKTLKLNDAISEQASDQIQEFRDLGNLIKSQTNDIKFQLQEKTELVNVSKSLTNLARETLDIENRSLGTSKDISKLKKIEERDHIRNFQPPISGEEIKSVFVFCPGKEVGIIKDYIKESILDGVIPNETEAARNLMLEKGLELGLKRKE